MKVAVYVSAYTPVSGGAYTFESDIFECFLKRQRGAAHQFAVLGPPSARQAIEIRIAETDLDFHAVEAPFVEQAAQAAVRQAPSFVQRKLRRASPLDRVLHATGCDLIWFVGAGPHRTERPYITVVWDVQHRVTPWFPELTAEGVWEEREHANGWFLQRASHVITGTEVGRAEIQRYYQVSPERISLLPHPTPAFALDAADCNPKPMARMPSDRPYLLYPAQFWPHKNHVNLLLALAELEKSGQGVDLALVGSDKGNRAHVERTTAELGLAHRVHMLGFVSREELIALYKHALALVYPSWFGPENLPPLEAFAMGCPVVASRIPGAEEQLGEAALLADPASPHDIAARIEELRMDAALRKRLVEAGRARALRWTAADYVSGVMGIIDRLEPVLRCWRPTGGAE